MSNQVIIFEELLDHTPGLEQFLLDLEIEPIKVLEAYNVLPTIRDHESLMVILNVSMPGLSGIECCRRIKERASTRDISVVLYSEMDSEALASNAENAGANYRFFGVNFIEPLKRLLASIYPINVDMQSKKIAPRVQASGLLSFVCDDISGEGELINISRSGLLVASDHLLKVGKKITMSLHPEQGGILILNGTVARTVEAKANESKLPFMNGVRFDEMPDEEFEKFEWLLAYRYPKRKSRLSAEFITKILDNGEHVLVQALSNWDPNILTGSLLDDVTEFEGNAFNEPTQLADAICELVLWRFQCNAFIDFLPTIQERSEELLPLFITRMRELLSGSQAQEERIDKILEQGGITDEERKELIQTTNRLHQAKLRLLFDIDEKLNGDALNYDNATLLKELKNEAKEIRQRQSMKID